MNCANHPDRERIAFCQNCGKPLCQECSRVVGTAVFCEPCLAARLAGAPAGYTGAAPADPFVASTAGAPFPPPASPDVPSPALATLLGLIPGVGAMYNGQYAKGVVHLIVFAILASIGGIFKLFTLGWIIYQVIDANNTARARLAGTPLPNPFGLNDIGERLGFGKTWPAPPPYTAPGAPGAPYTPVQPAAGSATYTADPSGNVFYTAAPPTPNWGAPENPTMPPTQPPYAPYAPFTPVTPIDPNNPSPSVDPYAYSRANRFPGGAIWLIGIGCIFLIANMGFFHGFPVRHLVPLFLIGFGVWLFVRRMTWPTPGLDTYNLRVFRALRGSVWVVLVGVLLLLESFDVIRWKNSWPLFLIVAGVMALFRTTVYSSLAGAPSPYYAPPVSPTTPPATATTTSIVPFDHETHDSQEGR